MGFLVKKPKEMIFSKIGKLAVILLTVAFSISFVDTIWAVYMDELVGNIAIVGFISAFLSLVSLAGFFLTIPIMEKYSKSSLFLTSVVGIFISYLIFAWTRNIYIFLVCATITTLLHTIRITSFGIIIKDKSPENKLSRNEGIIYTAMNLAWMIGPLIAGLISAKYGIGIIFTISGFMMLMVFGLFLAFGIKDVNVRKKIDGDVIKNLKEFFKDKNRVKAYILSGGVQFWWSLIFLFMPMKIYEEGLGNEWIGYFLFAVAIPLILFSYPFSKLAERIGFKKIFKIGYFIAGLTAIICFFSPNIYVSMGILVFSSVGLAMLEAPTEAYFLDLVRKKEVLKYYGPFNTTIDVHHFIGRGISAIILLLLPFEYLFLFFGIAMFFFFFIATRMKNVIESKHN